LLEVEAPFFFPPAVCAFWPLWPLQANLWKIFRENVFTRWVNWRQKRNGHFFQGRFKAVLVDGDSYLLELVRYIHLNPVRAGMVETPEGYPWSGHCAYLGKETLPWLTTDWMLGQFSASAAQANVRYRDFVLDGLGEKHRPEFHGGPEDSRLLGNDCFMEKCLSRSGEALMPVRITAREITDRSYRSG